MAHEQIARAARALVYSQFDCLALDILASGGRMVRTSSDFSEKSHQSVGGTASLFAPAGRWEVNREST